MYIPLLLRNHGLAFYQVQSYIIVEYLVKSHYVLATRIWQLFVCVITLFPHSLFYQHIEKFNILYWRSLLNKCFEKFGSLADIMTLCIMVFKAYSYNNFLILLEHS